MGTKPRVSFVVTTRNDDHGGEMLRRMTIFADGLAAQCRRHGFSAELIVVEWNPPMERPRLADAISWDAGGPLAVRIIEVPPEIHKTFRNSDAIPLFQMIAKNVGIRRARAPFVLATNIDLLFSDELISFLAGAELDPEVMYRIDRHDIPADVPDGSIEEQLAWCTQNLLRVHRVDGTRILDKSLLLKELEGLSPARRAWLKIRRGYLGPARRRMRRIIPRPFGRPVAAVHTNACGDFTLMSKEIWHKTRAYFELPMYSLHIDGIVCLMTAGMGFRQVILKEPMRAYHIEHGLGWAAMGFKERLDFFVARPWIDFGLVCEVNQWCSSGQPLVLNDKDWGLAKHELREEVLPTNASFKSMPVTAGPVFSV